MIHHNVALMIHEDGSLSLKEMPEDKNWIFGDTVFFPDGGVYSRRAFSVTLKGAPHIWAVLIWEQQST